MRKDGVSVKDIADLMQCSPNYIYRILRKLNGTEPIKKKQKIVAHSASAPATATNGAPSHDSIVERDRLREEVVDSSAALRCAVENISVSAYEPNLMSKPIQGLKQLQPHAQGQGTVSASVVFSTEASTVDRPHTAQTSNGTWILTDPASSLSCSAELPNVSTGASQHNQVQLQPSAKQLASASRVPISADRPSKQTSSSLSNLRANKTTSNAREASNGLQDLLEQAQNEIQRLQNLAQFDRYDAQVLHVLIKFHADVHLLQLKKTLPPDDLGKQEDQGVDNMDTSHLLRQKLSKEISLLSLQVDRERLELEREQSRHKTASIMCRKNLLEANSSPIDVDQLLPRQ